jgi:valyl-tRNA synthetase
VVKIFNAGRFVLQNLRDFDPQVRPSSQLEALDQWILFKTAETAARMAEQLEAYEYGKARQIFEEFFWRDFCDNYLELVKGRVYSQEQSRHSAQYALYHAYLSILKMIAPFLPHISEEMYHCEVDESYEGRLLSSHDKGYFFKFEQRPSIHLTPWPTEVPGIRLAKNMLELGGVLTLRVVREFRVAKTQVVKGERSPFTEMLVLCSDEEKKILEPFTQDIKNLSKVESLRLINNDATQVCQNNNQLVVLLSSKEVAP